MTTATVNVELEMSSELIKEIDTALEKLEEFKKETGIPVYASFYYYENSQNIIAKKIYLEAMSKLKKAEDLSASLMKGWTRRDKDCFIGYKIESHFHTYQTYWENETKTPK